MAAVIPRIGAACDKKIGGVVSHGTKNQVAEGCRNLIVRNYHVFIAISFCLGFLLVSSSAVWQFDSA